MSKKIDDLMKNRPELKQSVQNLGQGLEMKGAQQKDMNYDPHALAPQGQSRPHAQVPKPGLSVETQRQPNEVDKMLSARNQAATKDAGKELSQQQVTQKKEQDLER